MSARIKRNWPLLKALFEGNARQKRAILQTASGELINTICELALNVLKGNIPLTGSQLKKIRKQKVGIKLFANKKTSIKKKRKVLNQKGGFLLPLLSVAIPFLTSLIAGRSTS